jgi:hypothetical protein
MAIEARRLYRSPNGDRWHLAREPLQGEYSLGMRPTSRRVAK